MIKNIFKRVKYLSFLIAKKIDRTRYLSPWLFLFSRLGGIKMAKKLNEILNLNVYENDPIVLLVKTEEDIFCFKAQVSDSDGDIDFIYVNFSTLTYDGGRIEPESYEKPIITVLEVIRQTPINLKKVYSVVVLEG